jgi:hypothetical protein
MYNIKKSQEIAEQRKRMQVNEQMKKLPLIERHTSTYQYKESYKPLNSG